MVGLCPAQQVFLPYSRISAAPCLGMGWDKMGRAVWERSLILKQMALQGWTRTEGFGRFIIFQPLEGLGWVPTTLHKRLEG